MMPQTQIHKECVLEHAHFNLYHYHDIAFAPIGRAHHPQQKPVLLIVYALVNRPTILDLAPKRSFINALCAAGCDVYLIDWGTPNHQAKTLRLKNYALDFIDIAVNKLLTTHETSAINLMGICQGGVFSLCYTAWRPEVVTTLTPMVTPVNFRTADNLITPRINPGVTKEWVDSLGNFPGAALAWFLTMLKPEHTLWNKFSRFATIKDNTDEVALSLKMEQWIHDTPDQPGQVLLEFINDFYLKNSLMEPEYLLGNEKIIWSRIQQPVCNIYALQDHLVPPASSEALRQVLSINTKYVQWPISAGHIGLLVGRHAQSLAGKIGEWIAEKNSLRGIF